MECSHENASERNRAPEDEVRAAFEAAGLTMVGDYVNNRKPVAVVCQLCGAKFDRRPGQLLRRAKAAVKDTKGCEPCVRAQVVESFVLTEEEASTELLNFGYRPTEPYPGLGKDRWEAVHVRCGSTCHPNLLSLRQREVDADDACRYCQAGKGHNLNDPANLYLLQHPELGAIKVGVTKVDSTRLENYARDGWQVVQTVRHENGQHAYDAEAKVLAELAATGFPASFLSEGEMPSGWTETFSDDALNTALDLVQG